jgi:hypothetical protein
VPQLPFFCDQFVLRTLDDDNAAAALHRALRRPRAHRLLLAAAQQYVLDAAHFVRVEQTARFRALYDGSGEFRTAVERILGTAGRGVVAVAA